MVAPSREERESMTLSSWQPHFGQRIIYRYPLLIVVRCNLPHKMLWSQERVKNPHPKFRSSTETQKLNHGPPPKVSGFWDFGFPPSFGIHALFHLFSLATCQLVGNTPAHAKM